MATKKKTTKKVVPKKKTRLEIQEEKIQNLTKVLDMLQKKDNDIKKEKKFEGVSSYKLAIKQKGAVIGTQASSQAADENKAFDKVDIYSQPYVAKIHSK